MDKEVAKAINNLSKKLNAVQQQLDNFINQKSESNKADIDYVAMMTDVDIPNESEVEIDE